MNLPSRQRLRAVLTRPWVWRPFAAATAILLLYMLAGFVILPAVAKSQLEKLTLERFDRKLEIGNITFNPFTLVANVRDLKLMEHGNDDVFASFDALKVNLAAESIWRLAPVVQQAQLVGPQVRLVRTRPNQYNIDDILAAFGKQAPSSEPARFSVNNIQVEQGRIDFDDRPVNVHHQVTGITLGVPFTSSFPSHVEIFVEPLLSANVNGTPLRIEGRARPFANTREARIDLAFRDLDVNRYIEYMPAPPRAKVSGARLDLDLRIGLRQPRDAAPAVVLNGDATLKNLRVDSLDGKPAIGLAALTVTLRDTEPFSENIKLERVVLDGLQADLNRGTDGKLSLLQLLPEPVTGATKAASGASAARAGPAILLGTLDIRNARLGYTDAHAARPLQAGLDTLDLALRELSIDTSQRTVNIGEVASSKGRLAVAQGKPLAKTGQPAAGAGTGTNAATATAAVPVKTNAATEAAVGDQRPYSISVGKFNVLGWTARIEDGAADKPLVTNVAPFSLALQGISTAPGAAPAQLDLKARVDRNGEIGVGGTLALAPLAADLALTLKQLDLLPLQPYIADRINLRMTSAALSGSGQLKLQRAAGDTLKGGFSGDLTLANLVTVDRQSGTDFLRWKSLAANGVDMRIAPFALKAERVALSDFFARIILDQQGRINLQDVIRDGANDQKSLTDTPRLASLPAAAAATAQKAPAAPPGDSKPAPITIGKLTLQGGRVRFTDNFIRPNYSATLANFGGAVTRLSSDPDTAAGVDLRGEVNSAPLSVTGTINPLKGDLFLDLKAAVRGMELAPLSAYSGRYVGYGIEKGKLSFDVAYKLEQRVLTAENRLVLDQLAFGDKVESPSATELPVQFAVALLRDRNGVIDVNLPIAGSLDDPAFSVGGLIARVIVNLITKAVTQPFALIGSLFGGGAELSSLDFAPGRAVITPDAQARLQSLTTALTERPALKLEISGRADAVADLEGLRRVMVERKVRAIKIAALKARGETPVSGRVEVSPAEYPALLETAYRKEEFPKPRNVIGLVKSLPVEEMEKLMLAHAEVSADDLVALGNQRAQRVKNWLQQDGKVDPDRLFIVAPKVETSQTDAGRPALVASRVDFSLR